VKAAIRVGLAALVVVLFAAAVAASASAFKSNAAAPARATKLTPAQLAGVTRPAGVKNLTAYGIKAAKQVAARLSSTRRPDALRSLGLPQNLRGDAAYSAALTVNTNATATTLTESGLVADIDGKDDLVADHSRTLLSAVAPGIQLTRSAISEHTRANGFNEDIHYIGDSVGNIYVTSDSSANATPATTTCTINVPTVLNAFGTLNGSHQIVITGIGVNPVADLTSFSNVNGAFAGFAGKTGEIVYVAFWDTTGGFRLASNNVLVQSGLLAFPVADMASGAPAPPGSVCPAGFPITMGGSFGVVFSAFANPAGLAVDSNGNVFVANEDLEGLTGGNITEIASTDQPPAAGPPAVPGNQDRSLAVSGITTISTLNPGGGVYPSASGPANQVNRVTNYSGTSFVWGNVASLAAAPDDTIYAAVAAAKDPANPQPWQGPFGGPVTVPGFIAGFADYNKNAANPQDGFADTINGAALNPGINNYHAFVEARGGDLRGAFASFGTQNDTLDVTGFQIDYGIYGGTAVGEDGTVYSVSGGAPAGVGTNPSPTLGEVLEFPDNSPGNHRADNIDLRGDATPVGPNAGNSTPDGDSDRFDHLMFLSPLDGAASTPSGISGLNVGFLRYLNRTAANVITNLPNGTLQGDDDTTPGPVSFNAFDPSHQVAGGDLPAFPPPFVDYEYSIGGLCATPQTSFFLNSNGTVTFGAGDTFFGPSAAAYSGGPPRVGDWMDLYQPARTGVGGGLGGFPGYFPVVALGLSEDNEFTVRYINVPTFGEVAATQFSGTTTTGSNNTFSINMFDDGSGVNEGTGVAEGPRANRTAQQPGVQTRPEGSAYWTLYAGRMDELGATVGAVGAGFTSGAGPTFTGNISAYSKSFVIGTGAENSLYEIMSGNTANDIRWEGATEQISSPSNAGDVGNVVFRAKNCT
jgi:hypothetical protein